MTSGTARERVVNLTRGAIEEVQDAEYTAGEGFPLEKNKKLHFTSSRRWYSKSRHCKG